VTAHKALVVGINYGPEHSGIAPYTTAACEHLAREGVTVKVMTGVPHYPSWTVPHEYRRRLVTRESVNGVIVSRLLHFVPARQSALLRAFYELTFAVHVGWRARKWRGDTVVAVIPSLLSAVAAAIVARKANARLVVWVQDSMTAAAEQSGMSGGGWAARLLRPVESWVLRRAASIAVVSDRFREHAESFGVAPEAIEIVRNWSHVSAPNGDRAQVRERHGWTGKTVVLHAGNMGLKQGLDRVIDAAREASRQSSDLVFVLMGDGSQRTTLEQEGRGVPNLHFIDPAAEGEFMDTLAAADILLVCESPTVLDMSLPSKLTSYMAAGRPIVGAVRPEGATAREIEIAGSGVVVSGDDAHSLVCTIQALAQDKGRMEAYGLRGQRYAVSDLSPESSLGRITELVTTW
jgi:glycosyltransferase involved in cell wall biosynthesis